MNLLWLAVLGAHHSNSVFCCIHRQCLDSSTPPRISHRLQAPFPSHKMFGFSNPKNAPGSLSHKHICNVHFRLQSGAFHFCMSPYPPHIRSEKRNRQLVSLLICSYYMHQKAGGGVGGGGVNKAITLHKVYDDKKLCLFPPQLRGQMRQTTHKTLETTFNSEFGASASLSLSPEAVNNLRKTHLAGRDGGATASSRPKLSPTEPILPSQGHHNDLRPRTSSCTGLNLSFS